MVQLREDVPEAEAVLAELSLDLVGPLRFAPNLFEVDTTAHADALETSVALHDDPRIEIAVVRSTHDDLEDNAARGPAVELIAPGVDVLSTGGNGGYHVSTGTSFAAPCAAGCAALALAVHPGLTREQLRAVLHESAERIGGVPYDAGGHHDDYGYGRVNAAAAVQAAQRLLPAPVEEMS